MKPVQNQSSRCTVDVIKGGQHDLYFSPENVAENKARPFYLRLYSFDHSNCVLIERVRRGKRVRRVSRAAHHRRWRTSQRQGQQVADSAA
jgi:hypothetical protein